MKKLLSTLCALCLTLCLLTAAHAEARGELQPCLGQSPDALAALLDDAVTDEESVATGDYSVVGMLDESGEVIDFISVSDDSYTLCGYQCGMALNVVQLALADAGMDVDDSMMAEDGLLYADSADGSITMSFLFEDNVLISVTAMLN